MINLSPWFMKNGTCTVKPVSSSAVFVPPEDVSPLIPGSVSVTSSQLCLEVQHQVFHF